VNLDAAKVDATQAAAISGDVLATSLASGAINSEVQRIDTSVSTVAGSLATTTDILNADYLELSSVQSTLENTVIANDVLAQSRYAYNSTIQMGSLYYSSGFGLTATANGGTGTELDPYNSEFWINAEKFKFTNSNQTGQAAPFTIDASGTTPQITFNGLVTFGSSQTGTVDEAIAASVNTIAVGDKNVNITDNIIPTSSLVADSNNAGYQFVGTPTKSFASGIETFAEAQVVLTSTDEVYSPYVDEMFLPYYYRFGIKGITDLSVFKITTLDVNDVVTYATVVVTLDAGVVLSNLNWYIIDGN
jgi:hypothetical protein